MKLFGDRRAGRGPALPGLLLFDLMPPAKARWRASAWGSEVVPRLARGLPR